MTRPRQIITAHEPIVCGICQRSLLRGEVATGYLSDGQRYEVCELCEPRAIHDGWIREGVASEAAAMRPRRERRSLLARWRSEPAPRRAEAAARSQVEPDRRRSAPVVDDRHVHGIPTNEHLKVDRAIDTFNASGLPQRMTGIVKSLGAPVVSVLPSLTEGAIVRITIAWELAWYRFEVDLGDDSAGVRPVSRGTELRELDQSELQPTNALSADGRIVAAG